MEMSTSSSRRNSDEDVNSNSFGRRTISECHDMEMANGGQMKRKYSQRNNVSANDKSHIKLVSHAIITIIALKILFL
jgi:hypothetical protein